MNGEWKSGAFRDVLLGVVCEIGGKDRLSIGLTKPHARPLSPSFYRYTCRKQRNFHVTFDLGEFRF